MKKLLILPLVALFFVACFNNEKEKKIKFDFYGTYYSKSYSKKEQGNDWVAINLEKNDKKVNIKVYSRADVKKKQTCSYSGIAEIISNDELLVMIDEKPITIKVIGNKLSLDPKIEADSNVLFFYCNGGVSLRGDYYDFTKEKKNIKSNSYSYTNILEKGTYKFKILSEDKKLVIKTTGLKYEKEDIIDEINSKVVDSQIADINNDGFPEIYIYFSYKENGKEYADILAYSVNNGVSLSEITIEPLEYNKEALNGFLGNDIFKIENNKLIRNFPVGSGIKTIEYKLIENEFSWQLKIDKIKE